MKKYLSTAYITFTLYGDKFDPAEFTKIIGIQPESTGIKGEPGPYVKPFIETRWQCQSETTDALEGLDNSIDEFLKKFESKIDIINQYKANNNLGSKCFVVIFQKKKESVGALLSNAFIRFLNATDTNIEVCVYGY